MLERVIINILIPIATLIFGYYLGRKQDKISYQRGKRDVLYEEFRDLILEVRDKTKSYFHPAHMLYINFTEDTCYEHFLSKIYNNKLHNEIFSLNYKLERLIIDYGAFFKIDNYDFMIVDNHVSSIHDLENKLDRYINNKTQPIELLDISSKVDEIKKEDSRIFHMLTDMYEKTKQIYKADQR